MTSAWRYLTDANCVRHWHSYRNAGPAERLRALLPACGRIGALALPLLAGPAVATLPARVFPPVLPLIGQPDLYGGGAYAPFGPGFGGGGFGGGYGYAGESGFAPVVSGSIVPGVSPVGGEVAGGRTLIATNVPPQTALSGLGAEGTAAGGYPARAPTPQPVPCPPGLVVLAVALLGAIVLHKTERRLAGTAISASRATSKHGATHA